MTPAEIRASGLLELYIFGVLEDDDLAMVNQALAEYPELEHDLDALESDLLEYAESVSEKPHPAIKPFLLATVDFKERLMGGEQPTSAPELNNNSSVSEFSKWLDDPKMNPPEDFGAMYAKIIAFESEKTTAIAWLRYGAPDETHTNEYEKFLIVEGACDITIGETLHAMTPGDYLEIPLFVNHNVRVTSEIPCKVILQRLRVA